MAGVYRPRHPERTALYRVLFHYFNRFLAEYESRFEKQYGYLRPIIKEVVERYLDCGNPRWGFALMKRRRFLRTARRCPHPLSGMGRKDSLLAAYGIQCPQPGACEDEERSRAGGKYMVRPLLSLERLSLDEREGGVAYRYGKETRETERMDYLEFIARVTSHIPDKGQVTVR